MDAFIDGIIIFTIDYHTWEERSKNLAILMICTIFRPLQTSELHNTEDPPSLCKLEGDSQLTDLNTCLGQDNNTL